MQQTKKFKLDFTAATILALIGLAMMLLYRVLYWINFGGGLYDSFFQYYFGLYWRSLSVRIDSAFVYDLTFVIWCVACLFRNNKIIFRITAVGALAVRVCYLIWWSATGLYFFGRCAEMICCVVLVLCVLNVIRGVTVPTIFSVLKVLSMMVPETIMWGFSSVFSVVVSGDVVFLASVICYFLSQHKRQRIEKKQEEERNRQQIEQKLWQLKQYYDAKKINDQQYAYWKEELLKKL